MLMGLRVGAGAFFGLVALRVVLRPTHKPG